MEHEGARWADLLADLEGQFDAAEAAELTAEVGERTRREWLQVSLAARLRGSRARGLRLDVAGLGATWGVLLDSGPDWLLLGTGPAAVGPGAVGPGAVGPGALDRAADTSELLVPLSAVLAVTGLGPGAPGEAVVGPVAARWTLRLALAALARARTPVQVVLRDSAVLTGTVDRVGADHLDLAEHPLDVPRRSGQLTGVRCLPVDALACLRRRGTA